MIVGTALVTDGRPRTEAELLELVLGKPVPPGELPRRPRVGRPHRFPGRADRGDDPTVPHGTSSGYNYHRCSCARCLAWISDRARRHRDAVGARRDRSVESSVPHGTLSGYQYHRCSCTACRAANAAH